jgi:hypothetical protein
MREREGKDRRYSARAPDNGGPHAHAPRPPHPPTRHRTLPHPAPHAHTPRLVRAPPPPCVRALGRRSRRPHQIPARGPLSAVGEGREGSGAVEGDGARQAPRGRFPPRAPHIFLAAGPSSRRRAGGRGQRGKWPVGPATATRARGPSELAS